MLYILLCRDKPDSLEVRMANRDAHIEYAGQAGDRLKFAGPLLDDDGLMCGSMIVVEAASKEAAELVAANDPYNRAGLFESVEILPWKGVLGSWVPAA